MIPANQFTTAILLNPHGDPVRWMPLSSILKRRKVGYGEMKEVAQGGHSCKWWS